MNLPPRHRFTVAPHFHLPLDWSRRLLIGATAEEAKGWFPRLDVWRPPTSEELRLLVRAPDGPTPPEELEDCVCLFQLPGHLRSEWWKLLDQGAAVLGKEPLPGFDAFANQMDEFLNFKNLPLPQGARCDVVVTDPAMETGKQGEGFEGAASPASSERLWGGINLADEETSVVLIHPESPPVRLTLGPREGCRLPCSGWVVVGFLGSKQEPGVLLLISRGSGRSA
jgi:hypothetical protein